MLFIGCQLFSEFFKKIIYFFCCFRATPKADLSQIQAQDISLCSVMKFLIFLAVACS